jgi:3-hydroxyisobutyrate dehydrogenase-like beta-hydroxyacid dehydrogenase
MDVSFDALLGEPAAPPFLSTKRERIQNGNFDHADFYMQWLQKDLQLATISAYESGVSMPLTNLAKEIYRLAIREGEGDKDFSAINRYLAKDYGFSSGKGQH